MIGKTEKLRSAIGFAMKAGKVAAGEFAADKALKNGSARLIAVDAAASDNTKKQWQSACEFRKRPLVFIEDMGSAIGKNGRMVAAVTDENFSKMILNAAESCGNTLTTTEAKTDD
ncbi:MAG: ribosomal L7Ae/L30e/S12e/Gadd45 family protein [Clostridia bacterium]|nr:ribosomal L7Ae/L30e/S12e/Gadd45 family protein [Clostridia bacterium]